MITQSRCESDHSSVSLSGHEPGSLRSGQGLWCNDDQLALTSSPAGRLSAAASLKRPGTGALDTSAVSIARMNNAGRKIQCCTHRELARRRPSHLFMTLILRAGQAQVSQYAAFDARLPSARAGQHGAKEQTLSTVPCSEHQISGLSARLCRSERSLFDADELVLQAIALGPLVAETTSLQAKAALARVLCCCCCPPPVPLHLASFFSALVHVSAQR